MGVNKLLCFIKNYFVLEELSAPEFKKEYWRNVNLRKFYVKDIIENSLLIGKTKSEIESSFGKDESKHYYVNKWTYFVKKKGKRKYVLALYFEDDVLIDIRYEYRYIN
ncbi:hypothetical protein [Chryseobacterium taichungense]|uniref:hypothetical protein n=1 Tax=Chryseobacterium taichungense TaxID=295069 RepID=UPI0028B09802|nr:hypothetical protein [Chryseobacterium taichungense]